ncbi:hypothetical protein, partial [Escherichia coli]
RNKAKIVLIGAISALAGAANIVLMVLINKYIHVTRFDATSVATFGLVLLSVIGFTILSQVLLSRLGAETFMKLREGLVKGISNLSVQQVEAI